MTRLNWELAGLVDAKSGRLARPLPADSVVRPTNAAVANGCLMYHSGSCEFADIKAKDDLLDPFLALSDAGDGAVLKYARRNGVLMLCAHGLPVTHNPMMHPGVRPDSGCDGDFFLGMPIVEPVARWRMFARVAKAIIGIAARLHSGECGQTEDWAVIHEEGELFESMGWVEGRVDNEWNNLMTVLDQWGAIGNLRPRVQLGKRGPEIRIGGFLFGALALQLMSAVTRSEGLTICAECGGAFIPNRRPRRDERHYCQACGRTAALRAAQRDRRARMRNAAPGKT